MRRVPLLSYPNEEFVQAILVHNGRFGIWNNLVNDSAPESSVPLIYLHTCQPRQINLDRQIPFRLQTRSQSAQEACFTHLPGDDNVNVFHLPDP